jgi:hypothetical protein
MRRLEKGLIVCIREMTIRYGMVKYEMAKGKQMAKQAEKR